MGYVKLIAIAAVIGSLVYLAWDYERRGNKIVSLNKQVVAVQLERDQAKTALNNQIVEHNTAMLKIKDDLMLERERAIKAEALAEATEKDLNQIMFEADQQKAKYEGDRLARLSAAKGGLLTRFAKTGAKKRNTEWEALSNAPVH